MKTIRIATDRWNLETTNVAASPVLTRTGKVNVVPSPCPATAPSSNCG